MISRVQGRSIQGVDTTEQPNEVRSKGLFVPFGPRLSDLSMSVRRKVVTGLTLLMLAQGVALPAAAARTGAAGATTKGAPIEWVAADESGPAIERYHTNKSVMQAYGEAVSALSVARLNVSSHERNGPILDEELGKAQAALAAWTPADTTGLESWDKDLVLEDAANEKRRLEGAVADVEALIAAYPAEHAEVLAKLDAATARVAELDARLTPSGDEAAQSLEGFLKPGDTNAAYRIGLAAVVEGYGLASGRSPASLSPHEKAWLRTLGSLHPENVDARLASFEAWPRDMLQDVVAVALAPHYDADGAARAQRAAAALAYTPTPIDVVALGRWDDAGVDRMIDRAAQLEAVGLEWTDGLRMSPYPGGPAALTDFTSLLTLRADRDEVRMWIDPPSKLGARHVDVDFAALLDGARAWVGEGRRLTVEALPLVAIRVAGGEDAARLEKVLARVDGGEAAVDFNNIANLATVDALDDAIFARLDAVAERLGRPLTRGELASLSQRFIEHPDRDEVPSKQAIQHAQEHDPDARLDDIYVWSVATPQPCDALITSLTKRLAQTTHAHRSDRAAEYSERFEDHVDKLSTSDLVRIDWLLTALEDGVVRKTIGAQIEADQADETTELGGMFVVQGGAPRFVPLKPDAPESNNSFRFPAQVNPLASVVTAHLHAVGHTDGENAGPSSAFGGRSGDRGFTAESGRSDLVIADLGDGKFGVDYVNPEGAVVDLGVFSAK
ncbi:MAG: hypothetical protein RIT81_38375 [Deltaproteobacteria bacterium]